MLYAIAHITSYHQATTMVLRLTAQASFALITASLFLPAHTVHHRIHRPAGRRLPPPHHHQHLRRSSPVGKALQVQCDWCTWTVAGAARLLPSSTTICCAHKVIRQDVGGTQGEYLTVPPVMAIWDSCRLRLSPASPRRLPSTGCCRLAFLPDCLPAPRCPALPVHRWSASWTTTSRPPGVRTSAGRWI